VREEYVYANANLTAPSVFRHIRKHAVAVWFIHCRMLQGISLIKSNSSKGLKIETPFVGQQFQLTLSTFLRFVGLGRFYPVPNSGTAHMPARRTSLTTQPRATRPPCSPPLSSLRRRFASSPPPPSLSAATPGSSSPPPPRPAASSSVGAAPRREARPGRRRDVGWGEPTLLNVSAPGTVASGGGEVVAVYVVRPAAGKSRRSASAGGN
jgi:hypothetical protein